VFGDRSHRIVGGVADAHAAVRAVPDDVGHALLVVLVAVLGLIALLMVMTRLEPPRTAGGGAPDGLTPGAPRQGRRQPGVPAERV
jgi:hypothetical protein